MIDARAQHVRRQQVRGELDPPERTINTRRQRPSQEGLPHPGNILDQDVTFGQKGHHGQPDHLCLAQYHQSNVFE